MKGRQIVGSLLVASLMLGTPMATRAEELATNVLTIEQAIKKAKDTSIKLDQNERQEKLEREEADFAELMEGWDARQQKDVDRRYRQLEKDVIEEQIIRNIKQAFDDILYTEHSLKTLDKKMSVQEKQIEKTQKMKYLGFESDFSLEQVKLEYEQAKQSKKQLEQQIEVKYASLCAMMGNGSTQKYALEKEKNTFEIFELAGSLDAFASTRAEKDISLWKAKEDARIAENPIYTYDYMTIIRKREERAATKDSVKITKEQLEQKIKDNYAQVKQLESRYTVAQENLKIKEKELMISEIQFKNGAISQLDHDKKIMEFDLSKDELDKIVNDHTYLKQLLNKPYLS